MMQPVYLSSLKPSEAEIDEEERAARAKLIEETTFGELEEAIGNLLEERQQEQIIEACRRLIGGNALHTVDHIVIGALVAEAFRRHVEKYAKLDMAKFLESYQIGKAEELREQGIDVDWAC